MAQPDYGPLFQMAGKQYDIDPLLLQSIAKIEAGVDSQGRPLTSPAGAVGVMQFMPQTAATYGVNPADPVSSVLGAARYLADLRQQTNDNLPQMLSLYGGDSSPKYANSVLGVYRPLVAAWSKPPSAEQVSNTPAPPPGQRNASFIPPPGTPDVLIPQGTKGQAGQPAPGTPTTASSETPMTFSAPGSFTGPGAEKPGGAPAAQPQQPASFASSFFAKGPTAPAAPQPGEAKAAPPAGDFAKSFFATPTAPQAPAPAAAAPPVQQAPQPQPVPAPAQPPAPQPIPPPPPTAPDVAPVATPSTLPAPQLIPAAPTPAAPQPIPPAAPQVPAPPAAPPAPAQAPQNWWERNVATPFMAMSNPLTSSQPFLGVPLLQSLGAGLGQSVRDIGQTTENASRWLDENIPVLAAADRAIGFDPNAPSELGRETQAFEQQNQGNIPADIGRLAGDVAFSAPLMEAPIAAAGRVAETLPGVMTAAGALTRGGAVTRNALMGAAAGGVGNALTSGGYGEDPGLAAATGALGGGALGLAGGLIGNYFLRPTERVAAERTELADQLGIPLSVGQRVGGMMKRIEDTAAPIPGSGAIPFAARQRQAMARLLNGQMGQGAQEWIDYRSLAQATRDIGNRIDNAASRISITAPPGNPRFMTALNDIQATADKLSPTEGAPAARGLIAEIRNIASQNQGAIPGPDFQRLIQRGSMLDDAAGSFNPEVRRVGIRIKSALLDAAQASPTADPADLAAFNQGRYQWKVLKTIDGAIEKSAGGTDEMSLPALARDIRGEFDMLSNDPMPGLARLIASTPEIASSGTAERALWQRLMGLGGVEGGPAGVLWMLGHPQAAEQAALATGGFLASNVGLSRLSRFGPGMGWPWLEGLRQTYNPLLARVAGPYAGRVMTGQPPPSGQQQP